MQVTPELMRFIDLIAEAKMHLLFLRPTRPRSNERREQLEQLRQCTAIAREYLEKLGGLEKLPKNLAIDMRVCEKAVEHYTEQERKAAN